MQTKEEKAKYRKQWLSRNRKKHQETNKRWAERNREKHLKIQRESYHRNKHKNRVRRLERSTKWYYKNKDRVSINHRKILTNAKEKVFRYYGKKCACCGLVDEKFLTVDHVNNGKGNGVSNGRRRIPSVRLYQQIIKEGFPKTFQILCMNCNWAKGQYGVCPHQTDREGLEIG